MLESQVLALRAIVCVYMDKNSVFMVCPNPALEDKKSKFKKFPYSKNQVFNKSLLLSMACFVKTTVHSESVRVMKITKEIETFLLLFQLHFFKPFSE